MPYIDKALINIIKYEINGQKKSGVCYLLLWIFMTVVEIWKIAALAFLPSWHSRIWGDWFQTRGSNCCTEVGCILLTFQNWYKGSFVLLDFDCFPVYSFKPRVTDKFLDALTNGKNTFIPNLICGSFLNSPSSKLMHSLLNLNSSSATKSSDLIDS